MYINSQLSTCVCTQSPKYLEMAQGHISLSETETDTERRENVLAARFRDTERESAGVGLTPEIWFWGLVEEIKIKGSLMDN